jgi:hypothetical protein
MGLGLGYRCHNFKGDLETVACRVGVAIGVPTRNFPTMRESYGVQVNLMALYCGASLAIDSGAYAKVTGYHWWPTNGAVWVGAIPGVSTGYCCAPSLRLENNYFTAGNPANSPIHLWGAVFPALDISQCRFDLQAGTAAIKSHTANADDTRIGWHDSLLNVPAGASLSMFENSSGIGFSESSWDQTRFFNKTLGIYNVHQQTQEGGSGYLLDIVDGFYQPSGNEPIARIGHTWGTSALSDFWGGLTVQYDRPTDAPTVTITNADLYVVGSRPSGSPGGQIFAQGPVNSTNGFRINSAAIITGHGPPNIAAAPGSMYLNLDGGAGTSFYVKETGTGTNGWQGK